jgi:transcriptional regulator with XRE-family HTH domain
VRIKLKQLRESRFLTQRELAAKAHVGVATIVRIEKGRQVPTFQTIKRLAAALAVNPSDLAQHDDPSTD